MLNNLMILGYMGIMKQENKLEEGWEDQFSKDLDMFIVACLKKHSIHGSLTKSEMVAWFKSRVEFLDRHYQCPPIEAEI